MRVQDGRFSFSPSDLNGFLACPHLTSLQVAVARGELKKPFRLNAQAELIRAKGDEHEARLSAELRETRAGNRRAPPISTGHVRQARPRTTSATAAMSSIRPIFVDGNWRGLADFVMRQPDGTYEVLDTKLARHTRPAHILQLCFYTEQIARIQSSMPSAMHVVTGTGELETFGLTITSPSTAG